MNTVDKISRDAKLVVDSVKDSVVKNLTSTVYNKQLDLTENQLFEVVKLVEISVNEGYQRSLNVFQNTVKKYLP
jgi:hypothetical protein